MNAQPKCQRRREGSSGLRAYRAFLSDVLAFDQPKDDQQDHGADEGVDNGGDKAAADYDA